MIIEYDLTKTASASFSKDRIYRYRLTRTFDGLYNTQDAAVWILLNPSTADAFQLDPTLRRVAGFSKRLGHRGFVVLNAFAFRSTDPCGLLSEVDPVGPENDTVIGWYDRFQIICGWGSNPLARSRVKRILELLPDSKLMCLGTNANGSPRHPLYVPASTKLQPWIPNV